jgi:mannose-1-phosphate guanylyltransferase
MKAVVLCAGYGTRLGSLTEETPKPMLPMAGRPMLEHILVHLRRHGFSKIAINLHFRPEVITSYFGDGRRWDLELSYFAEPTLLGTAGALVPMRGFLQGEAAFLVQYGDVITNADLSAMRAAHIEQAADATIMVHERARSNSVVALDRERRVIGFLERPTEEQRQTLSSSWVNSGVGLFAPTVLDWIPERVPADLPRDVLVPHVPDGRIFAHPLRGYRCAVDSPERYAAADEAIRAGQVFPRAAA